MGSADKSGQVVGAQVVVAVACWAGVGDQVAGAVRSLEEERTHTLRAPRPEAALRDQFGSGLRHAATAEEPPLDPAGHHDFLTGDKSSDGGN